MSAPRHWLVRLYPPAWRERYGDELGDLLADHRVGPRDVFDVARAALTERIHNPSGLGVPTMQTYRGSTVAMARHPSAFVPLILSGCALALLVGYLSVFGIGSGRTAHDEGATAHLYQLLIGAQLLIIPWFALRWSWREWRAGATLLALQALAITASFAPLWLIEH